jgi:L-alanine-DL-glutamate epimerase-like enolase superfamily enzyme
MSHAHGGIERLQVAAYTIPTDAPESDGTFEWHATTIVVVHAEARGATGMGYTYAPVAAAHVAQATLAEAVAGIDPFDVEQAYVSMRRSVRNMGRDGIAACAISAVDAACWDLKARLLNVPVVSLLGAAARQVPLYGSGGFTSYTIDRLQQQLGGWVSAGLAAVKMKIGRDPAADRERVRAARQAIGPSAGLFVDANGACDRKLALAQAEAFAPSSVTWFEEPVSSDDLEGLRLLRDRGPAGMDIAAGEYGFDIQYFRRMLEAGAVDVLQADATRCGGITGFVRVAALCDAWALPLSAHTAPSLHAHVCCAVPRIRHLEYFHDHVRIEQMLFDGVLRPRDGALWPDLSQPGLGLALKERDAQRFAA